MPMRRAQRLLVALLLALGCGATVAEPGGNGFDLGVFRAYPWLDVLFNYESNYYRSNSELERLGFLGPMSTWESIVIPGIRLTTLNGADAYNLSYNARIGSVFESSDDDFVDQRAAANASWELGSRHRLRADYEFLDWHDRRALETRWIRRYVNNDQEYRDNDRPVLGATLYTRVRRRVGDRPALAPKGPLHCEFGHPAPGR